MNWLLDMGISCLMTIINDSSIVDQTYTLEGVDLVAGNGLEAVIQDMLTSGKLIVDQ